MFTVAVAGVDPESTMSCLVSLSGSRLDDTELSRFVVSEAHLADTAYTLIGLPPVHQKTTGTRISALLLSDAVVVVVPQRTGWTEQQARLVDEVRTAGVQTLVIAVDGMEGSTSLLHAVRQHIGGYRFTQSAVVSIDTVAKDFSELQQTLATVLPATTQSYAHGESRLWTHRIDERDGVGAVAIGFVTGNGLRVGDKLHTMAGQLCSIAALQQLEERAEQASSNRASSNQAPSGAYVAAGLTDLDASKATDENVLAVDGIGPSNQVDCIVHVRRHTDEPLHATNTYVARVGSVSCKAALHTLEGTSLAPEQEGTVRVRLSQPLPLLTGDRVALCDSVTGELVAGGVVRETSVSLEAVENDELDKVLPRSNGVDL